MNFSLIIPNLNGAHLLPACLQSIKKSIKHPQIILVDNGSTDNSVAIAKKIYPQIKIIKNSKNFGFAKAVNQGILTASGSYVVICNNDITIHPDYFKIMAQAIKNHPQAAAFTGTTLNKTGDHIESTGLKFDYSGKCTHFKKNYHQQHPQTIWGAPAALVTYHRPTLQKIGLFDEKFFAYEEDVDLSLRFHGFGLKTLWIPQAIAYHLGGATSSKMGNFRQRMDAKNWIYLIIKNYSAKQIWQNLPGIIDQRLRNLSGLLKHTPFCLWLPTILSVYGQVIINLPHMLHSHRQIKKQIVNQSHDHWH